MYKYTAKLCIQIHCKIMYTNTLQDRVQIIYFDLTNDSLSRDCMQNNNAIHVHAVSHQSRGQNYRLKYGFLRWEQLCDEMPGLFRWLSSAFSRTRSALQLHILGAVH